MPYIVPTGTAGGATFASLDLATGIAQGVSLYIGAGRVATDNALPIQGIAGSATIGSIAAVASVPGTAAEGGALPSVIYVVAGDDGTDTHPLQVDAAGNLKVTATGVSLDAGTATVGTVALQAAASVALGAGTATVGTVALQGDASVALGAGTATVGTVAFQGAASVALGAGTATVGTVALGAGTATVGTVALAAGTATIGTVALQAGGTVGLEAGTATVGSVSAAQRYDTVMNGQAAMTPKFAAISATASGDIEIVTAVAGKKMTPVQYVFISNGAATVQWKDGSGGTALSGAMAVASQSGASVPYSPLGHMQTTSGVGLFLNVSAAITVAGHLTYLEVT